MEGFTYSPKSNEKHMAVIRRSIEQFECPACGVTLEKEDDTIRAKVVDKPENTETHKEGIIEDDTPTVEVISTELDPMK